MLATIARGIQYIVAIGAMLTLIEPLRQVIHVVEGSGTGPEKKSAVMEFVQAALTQAESVFSVNLPDSLVLGFVGAAIDLIVTIENLRGTLKGSAPAEA